MEASESAFPVYVPGGEMQRGMSQRVYLAAAAMQALIASPEGSHDIDRLVDKAFKLADAFLVRARKRD